MGRDAGTKGVTFTVYWVSIHAPRMGRDITGTPTNLADTGVSIHAPRMGRDVMILIFPRTVTRVSIHAPRMGRDAHGIGITDCRTRFNPRAPHGARHCCNPLQIGLTMFQSTRPAWGATLALITIRRELSGFNPRAPHGARPVTLSDKNPARKVSIHAPRMGRDKPGKIERGAR